MTLKAIRDAKALLKDLEAVMPADSIIIARLKENFATMARVIGDLKYAADLRAVSDTESDWLSNLGLSAKEMDILNAILSAGPQGRSLTGILAQAYCGYHQDEVPAQSCVQVHIARIRSKFKAAGLADPIETIRGRGYRASSFPVLDVRGNP